MSKYLLMLICNLFYSLKQKNISFTLGPKMFGGGGGDFWLETRVIIKISTHSWYPRTFDRFSWKSSKKIFFCFIPMKISQSFLCSQDGSKFLWLPWFPDKNNPPQTFLGECSLTYFPKTLLSHFFLVFLFLDLPCLHYHKSNLSVSTTNNKKYKCNSLNGNHFISLRICIF